MTFNFGRNESFSFLYTYLLPPYGEWLWLKDRQKVRGGISGIRCGFVSDAVAVLSCHVLMNTASSRYKVVMLNG